MKLRRNKAIAVELNEQITLAINDNLNKTERIEKDKLLAKMQEAIEKLNPQQQQCVNLFYLQKKSYAEITEITGLTMMQVKSHLQNGKRNLKMMMEN
jgi:RNA polymerase sigma-70 factor (ECF subfamily)